MRLTETQQQMVIESIRPSLARLGVVDLKFMSARGEDFLEIPFLHGKKIFIAPTDKVADSITYTVKIVSPWGSSLDVAFRNVYGAPVSRLNYIISLFLDAWNIHTLSIVKTPDVGLHASELL